MMFTYDEVCRLGSIALFVCSELRLRRTSSVKLWLPILEGMFFQSLLLLSALTLSDNLKAADAHDEVTAVDTNVEASTIDSETDDDDDDDDQAFERVPVLEGHVRFWRSVYGEWGANDIALHHPSKLERVYRVVRVAEKDKATGSKRRRGDIQKALNETRAALDWLDEHKPSSSDRLSGVRLEVFRRLEGVHAKDKYTRDAGLRAQNGVRERLGEGYRTSGAYAARVREMLTRAGLRDSIVALAFLESLMDIDALSSVGAAGVWQFMGYTAKEYMIANDTLDERRDPILATQAAAHYLSLAHKEVGPWPVAITSYNYGRSGMRNAIRSAGTNDLGALFQNFRHQRWGFSARNYYAAFLGVHDLIEFPESYGLSSVSRKEPWSFDAIRLPFDVGAKKLLACIPHDSQELFMTMNPAIKATTFREDRMLPLGLGLRIPQGLGEFVLEHVLDLREAIVREEQERLERARRSRKVTVKNGDSLSVIAVRFDVSLNALMKLNGLTAQTKIFPGQSLSLPDDAILKSSPTHTSSKEAQHRKDEAEVESASLASEAQGDFTLTHDVANTTDKPSTFMFKRRKGDTWMSIAHWHRVPLAFLLKVNGVHCESGIVIDACGEPVPEQVPIPEERPSYSLIPSAYGLRVAPSVAALKKNASRYVRQESFNDAGGLRFRMKARDAAPNMNWVEVR